MFSALMIRLNRKSRAPTNRKNYLRQLRKCAKMGKGKTEIDSSEFTAESDKRVVAWDIEGGKIENQAGDYYRDFNREFGEEKQVNSAIGGNQLVNHK